MAEDVRSSEAIVLDQPTTSGSERTQSRSERARRGAYRYRFAAIYFVLAAIVGAAVGSFVVLAGRDDAPKAAAWSSWEPDGSDTARVRQIADRVPRGYHQGGRQLVFAIGGPPQVNVPNQGEVPVGAIAVQPDTSRGQREEGDFDVYPANSAITYRLCGGGAGCSVSVGTPSADRLQLLRREALELSLYTLKYVKGVDSVVVFLPPAPPAANGDQQSSGALFLRRKDVEDELGVPLQRTLAAKTPAVGAMQPGESANVDRLTRPNVYGFTYQPAADNSFFLVLQPSTTA